MAPRLVLRQLPLFSEDEVLRRGPATVPAIGVIRKDWQTFAHMHGATKREMAIAERLGAFDETDGELAAVFHCSERTINHHVAQLRQKFKARSRTQVAQLAVGGAECECHPGWTSERLSVVDPSSATGRRTGTDDA